MMMRENTTSAIEANDLTKRYPSPFTFKNLLSTQNRSNGLLALDSVSFSIPKGKIFGLVGPNGAGKTTLIKILCTLIWPTSGEALVEGFDVTCEEDEVKEVIGLVSGDERSFYWRLTGKQNLEFFATLCNLPSTIYKKKISELVCELGLEKWIEKKFFTYSSGVKQRMAIARGLLNNPSVLFLDEPTKSLDPRSAHGIYEIIRKISRERGTSIVFATHRLEEVEKVCDGLIVLNQGKVCFCGSVGELKSKFNASVDETFLKLTGDD